MLSKLLSKEVFSHQSLINADLPEQTVAYCGSGVFATDENKAFQLAYVNITTASGVDGRQVVSAQGNTNYFYLKDLLGSTRAVINQNGQGTLTIAEAIMYHSYGSMQYIQVATAETREKFTGKELDQEGEKYCEARFSITFNDFFRSANPADPSPTGSVTVTYTDGSSETMSLSILWTCFKLEQSFKYYSDKTISNISYALYNYVTSPAETNLRNLSGSVNITQNIAIGQQLHITGTATRTDMEANPNEASYYSFDNTTLRINGMELCYFGKRYFDPEVGVWISTDQEEQYANAYSYCGSDPINLTDPDGNAGELILIEAGKLTGQAVEWGLEPVLIIAGNIVSKAFLPTIILTTSLLAIDITSNIFEQYATQKVQKNIVKNLHLNENIQATQKAQGGTQEGGKVKIKEGDKPNEGKTYVDKNDKQYKFKPKRNWNGKPDRDGNFPSKDGTKWGKATTHKNTHPPHIDIQLPDGTHIPVKPLQ